MVELCASLRAERKERWHKLGGSVGLSEWDIKGGAPQPAIEKAVETASQPDPVASDKPTKPIHQNTSDTVIV
jgi:hypothetical protein